MKSENNHGNGLDPMEGWEELLVDAGGVVTWIRRDNRKN